MLVPKWLSRNNYYGVLHFPYLFPVVMKVPSVSEDVVITAFTLGTIYVLQGLLDSCPDSIPMMFHDLCCVSVISFTALIWC